MSETQQRLVIATVQDNTYEAMKTQLKKVFVGKLEGTNVTVKNESEEIHFHQKFKSPPLQNRDDSFKWKKYVEENKYRYDKYQGSFRKKSKNPLDSNGKVTRCWICDSVNHWSKQCPDRESWSVFEETSPKGVEMNVGETFHALTLHMSDHKTYGLDLVSESCTSAVVDTGPSKTVCGDTWFRNYFNTLNEQEKMQVKYFKGNNVFSFGNKQVIKSSKVVDIPVKIGKVNAVVKADIINMNIPLLLSLDSLKKGGVTNFDLMDETITILDQKIKLKYSKSGHLLLPLTEQPKSKGMSNRKQIFTPQQSDKLVNRNVESSSKKVKALRNPQAIVNGKDGMFEKSCKIKGRHDETGINFLTRCRNYDKTDRFSYKYNFDSSTYYSKHTPGKQNRKKGRFETEKLSNNFENTYPFYYKLKDQMDSNSVTFDEWCKLRKKKRENT